MKPESIFDLASVTKVSATTVSIMKLYEQGKINLNKTLGDYLPWTKGTDKARFEDREIFCCTRQDSFLLLHFTEKQLIQLPALPIPAIYSDE